MIKKARTGHRDVKGLTRLQSFDPGLSGKKGREAKSSRGNELGNGTSRSWDCCQGEESSHTTIFR